MVETGERMGKQVVALITDMDQPLGQHDWQCAGSGRGVDVLRGGGPEDLERAVLGTGGDGCCISAALRRPFREGKQQSAKLISSGKALEKFRQMVELQGGEHGLIDDPEAVAASATHLR